MALLAGNAVILKVASGVPNVRRVLASAFAAAGLLAYVEMPGKEVERPLFRAALTNSFSPVPPPLDANSWLWPPRAFSSLCRNPAARADMERAANGIVWAGFSNAGQSRGGVQRVFAPAAVYERFLKKPSSAMEKLRSGDSRTEGGGDRETNGMDYDIGPMFNLKQKRAVAKQPPPA